jgi:2-polyprenyl-6-methoxyphenol hydroxylase-like FAD-dependent oxidoreductase
MEQRAVVVGAGIAGLAMAHALNGLGYSVRVLEREAELPAEGAGLTLWPNATRALAAVGLADVVTESTQIVEEAVTLTPTGEILARVPLDRIVKRFGPLVSARRSELLSALRARVRAEVTFGVEVGAADGELFALGEKLDAELIVGADGIGSAVRQAVAPGIAPRAAGYAAWRGVAETGEATPDRASETMGRGRRFGLVPLNGGRTYWFAVLADGDGSNDLEAEFAGWHPPIADVLAATPAQERSYLPLFDLPHLPRWHRDRIVLIGDAAHATTPNLGQGAAQALEDVAALASLLNAQPPAEAFQGLEHARKRRAERIVRQSRAMGRIAQTSNPIAASLRDLVARRTPAALAALQLGRILDSSDLAARQGPSGSGASPT